MDLDFILSIDGYNTECPNQFLQCFPCDSHGSQVKTTVQPVNDVSSLSIKFSGLVDLSVFKCILDNLLYDNGNKNEKKCSIFRMKGLLHVNGERQLYILQSVHSIFDVQPSTYAIGSPLDPTGGLNLIIIIGCDLGHNFLISKFDECVI